jgi:hypothetical protein
MKKHVRQILDEAIRAASAHGIAVHIEDGGKHQRLVFEGFGARRVKPVSGTPSDADVSIRLARADVKRLLREMVSA